MGPEVLGPNSSENRRPGVYPLAPSVDQHPQGINPWATAVNRARSGPTVDRYPTQLLLGIGIADETGSGGKGREEADPAETANQRDDQADGDQRRRTSQTREVDSQK